MDQKNCRNSIVFHNFRKLITNIEEVLSRYDERNDHGIKAAERQIKDKATITSFSTNQAGKNEITDIELIV